MKIFFIGLFIVFFSFYYVSSVYAHSGCCSHHDGVRSDGCGCNDGTPLSETCAPYYSCNAPQQKTNSVNTYTLPAYVLPTNTPIPIPTNTPIPTVTPTPTIKPSPTPIKKVVKTIKKSIRKPTPTPTFHKSWWQKLFGL